MRTVPHQSLCRRHHRFVRPPSAKSYKEACRSCCTTNHFFVSGFCCNPTIAAGNTVNLAADNAIRLKASQNTWEQHGTNKSSGTSIGVGYAAGAQNGFTIELGMSQGKGKDDGSEVSTNNTHVSGGKAVNVIGCLRSKLVRLPQCHLPKRVSLWDCLPVRQPRILRMAWTFMLSQRGPAQALASFFQM